MKEPKNTIQEQVNGILNIFESSPDYVEDYIRQALTTAEQRGAEREREGILSWIIKEAEEEQRYYRGIIDFIHSRKPDEICNGLAGCEKCNNFRKHLNPSLEK